jgi:hypothetical protein
MKADIVLSSSCQKLMVTFSSFVAFVSFTQFVRVI